MRVFCTLGMKTLSPKKKKSKIFKRNSKNLVKKKKKDHLSVCLLPKLSNGTSNWDKLNKILGKTAVLNGHVKTSPVAKMSEKKKSPEKKTSVSNDTKSFSTEKKKDAVPRPFKKSTTTANCDVRNPMDSIRNGKVHEKAVIKKVVPISVPGTNSKTAGPAKVAFPRGKLKHRNENVEPKIDLPSHSSLPVKESKRESESKWTKHVAMDCEMVGTGATGTDSMIARVSIVNRYGDTLYDEYVTPKDDITDYRTHVSGIRPSDLTKGKDLFTVQKEVLALLEGRVLVGHALKNDLDVLFISHPKYMIRDSAKYKPFRQLFNGRTPSLKNLSAKLLGKDIQSGEHNSVEDAQAAMQLYLMHRNEWEKSIKQRRRRHVQNKNTEEH